MAMPNPLTVLTRVASGASAGANAAALTAAAVRAAAANGGGMMSPSPGGHHQFAAVGSGKLFLRVSPPLNQYMFQNVWTEHSAIVMETATGEVAPPSKCAALLGAQLSISTLFADDLSRAHAHVEVRGCSSDTGAAGGGKQQQQQRHIKLNRLGRAKFKIKFTPTAEGGADSRSRSLVVRLSVAAAPCPPDTNNNAAAAAAAAVNGAARAASPAYAISVVRHRLLVTQHPPHEWHKEGSKKRVMTVKVQVVDSNLKVVKSRRVPLSVALVYGIQYGSDQLLKEPQAKPAGSTSTAKPTNVDKIFRISPESALVVDKEQPATILFRVEAVSRTHMNRPFAVLVKPDVIKDPSLADIAPVQSSGVIVVSKEKAKRRKGYVAAAASAATTGRPGAGNDGNEVQDTDAVAATTATKSKETKLKAVPRKKISTFETSGSDDEFHTFGGKNNGEEHSKRKASKSAPSSSVAARKRKSKSKEENCDDAEMNDEVAPCVVVPSEMRLPTYIADLLPELSSRMKALRDAPGGKASTEHASMCEALQGLASWCQFVSTTLQGLEWHHVASDMDGNPIFRCPACRSYKDAVRTMAHAPDCVLLRARMTFSEYVGNGLMTFVDCADTVFCGGENGSDKGVLRRKRGRPSVEASAPLSPNKRRRKGANDIPLSELDSRDSVGVMGVADFMAATHKFSLGGGANNRSEHDTLPSMDPVLAAQSSYNAVIGPMPSTVPSLADPSSFHLTDFAGMFDAPQEDMDVVCIVIDLDDPRGFPAFGDNNSLLGYYVFDDASATMNFVSRSKFEAVPGFDEVVAALETSFSVRRDMSKEEALAGGLVWLDDCGSLPELREHAAILYFERDALKFIEGGFDTIHTF